MLFVFVIGIAVVTAVLYLVLMGIPMGVQNNILQQVNYSIVDKSLTYTIDKNFIDNGENLQEGYYAIGYYVDSSDDEKNDSIQLNFIGQSLNSSNISQLGSSYPNHGYISQFVEGQDGDNRLALKVVEGYDGCLSESDGSFVDTEDGLFTLCLMDVDENFEERNIFTFYR